MIQKDVAVTSYKGQLLSSTSDDKTETNSPSKGDTVLRPRWESSEGQASLAGFLNTHPIFNPCSICSTLQGRQAHMNSESSHAYLRSGLCHTQALQCTLCESVCLSGLGRQGDICQALRIVHFLLASILGSATNTDLT